MSVNKQLREQYEQLCYENDEINRKWTEDNERNGDILSAQQEQIERLEEENIKLKGNARKATVRAVAREHELSAENELLKNCDIMQYSYLVQGENKLLKEWQDMKNELGWYKEHVEILEKQLDRRD